MDASSADVRIVTTDRLTDDQRTAVLTLVEQSRAVDGAAPLNDEAMLDLHRDGAHHWLIEDGTGLAGYATASSAFRTGQVLVRPDARCHGLGTALVTAAMSADLDGVWAFGDTDAARATALSTGLESRRELLIMERPLAEDIPARTAPEGITLGTFTEEDADGMLLVNATAFAHHPEQGTFSRADLDERMAESWWDPAGFIIARDAEGVVGFHWTKRHDADTGEVYVIGVAPRGQGRGLGTVLLDAGLAHLRDVGCSRVILYVEADNPAVHLYERSGFRVIHTDALYGRPQG